MDKDNIVSLVPQGKQADQLPAFDYYIYTDDEQHAATGFLIFTSHHVAIMRDTPQGAVPILVVPLERVTHVELYEDGDLDEDDEGVRD